MPVASPCLITTRKLATKSSCQSWHSIAYSSLSRSTSVLLDLRLRNCLIPSVTVSQRNPAATPFSSQTQNWDIRRFVFLVGRSRSSQSLPPHRHGQLRYPRVWRCSYVFWTIHICRSDHWREWHRCQHVRNCRCDCMSPSLTTLPFIECAFS